MEKSGLEPVQMPKVTRPRPRVAVLIIICSVSLLFLSQHLFVPKENAFRHHVTPITPNNILCDGPKIPVKRVAIIGW